MFYHKLDFPNFKQMTYKVVLVHLSVSQVGQDLFLFCKKKPLLLLFISKSKQQKLNKEKCEKEILLYSKIDCKYLCINIYSKNITERVGKNFIRLSAESAFSFLGIVSERKKRNWQKVFYNTFYRKFGIHNFKQRPSNVA